MNIDGYQRNNQISKAYLLLGKARYYDRRYFQALETFNYLINQYSDKNNLMKPGFGEKDKS